MELERIEGKPVRFPPGRLAIRLDEGYKSAYRRLYGQYQSILAGLPVLKERDFDGRAVLVTPAHLDALNAAFSNPNGAAKSGGSAFGTQESARERLFKRLQYLS